MPNALITGITGQDGSYLAEYLLGLGYEVFGLVRRSSTGPNMVNLKHIQDDINLLQGDMTDSDSLKRAVQKSEPDEIYNLAAQSFVPMSWASPTYTINVNMGGFVYLLEAVRDLSNFRGKIYQASTSEMFGNSGLGTKARLPEDWHELVADNGGISLNENSPMRPRSPYGASKLGAHRMAQVYRESFGMHVSCGILFNHESPRRGPMFVTRKITKAVADIHAGLQTGITLGSMDARRDWGYAGDYVRAMHMILQQVEPRDYVVGTGITHSVEDIVVTAFKVAEQLTGRVLKPWHEWVDQSELFARPAEIWTLKADASDAKNLLGWRPNVDFKRLIGMMVEHDLRDNGLI